MLCQLIFMVFLHVFHLSMLWCKICSKEIIGEYSFAHAIADLQSVTAAAAYKLSSSGYAVRTAIERNTATMLLEKPDLFSSAPGLHTVFAVEFSCQKASCSVSLLFYKQNGVDSLLSVQLAKDIIFKSSVMVDPAPPFVFIPRQLPRYNLVAGSLFHKKIVNKNVEAAKTGNYAKAIFEIIKDCV